MSYTVSPGKVDVTRWAGVAAHLSDYLGDWVSTGEPPRDVLSRGTLLAAERFLTQVIAGLAVGKPEAGAMPAKPMAGVSNLAIALDVIAAIGSDVQRRLTDVARSIDGYRNVIRQLREERPPPAALELVTSMHQFFTELHRQADSRRYAELIRPSE